MGLPTDVNVTIWLFFAVTCVFMFTRTVAARMTRKLGVHIFLAYFSFFTGLAANIMCSISVHYGAGRHQRELDLANIVEAVKWQWFLFQTYVVAVMVAKLAIIAFLLEFEASITSRRKWLLYIVAFINIAVNMGTSSLQWQQCDDVRATWDFRMTDVECNGRERNTQGGYVQGSFAAAIDVFLALYPAIVFWHLKMDRRVRIGLCALFSCGFVSCALAILKTIGISKLAATDATHDLAILDIYSLVELWVALIVGSIPPSKPVYNRYVRRRAPSTSQSRSGYIEHSSNPKHGHRSGIYSSSQGGAGGKVLDKYDIRSSATNGFGSEESILPPLEESKDGIMLTKTVRVDNEQV